MQEKVLILDFGSQYTQLIARRVRELFIYCEIHPYNNPPKDISSFKAVILSGSPFSVRAEDAPHPDLEEIKGKIPLLGICYGAQYLAHFFGGEVSPSNTREYGRAHLSSFNSKDSFFKGVSENSQVWMSHADTILTLPSDAERLGSTEDVSNAAYKFSNESTYAIQFHPEVFHSTDGKQILENFLVGIAEVKQDWTPDSFVEMTLKEIQEKVGQDKVILGLSGGVDSSVAALLLHRAIGDQLNCIFVNNGLLRKNEFEEVLEQYSGMGLNVKGVNASDQFLDALDGISDPETKRKIIGKIFIDVFDAESQKVEGAKWLGQGTIYPDVIESISVNGPSATIKSHHNVGGLPDYMKLKLVEPLRMLFKDEVRRVGKSMGMDAALLGRHPFPGPGLAIRILGEITREKVRILQEVDALFIQGLRKWDLYDQIWQAGAVFLPVNSVGVMGDERTYENCVALRAVQSTDGMTADWVDLPYAFLQKISNEIINNVKGINRVVYDISSKPPATIEWE
ncbi:MAG: glutamine-hydrolyzing GMP synthase [Flavobacteriaceae bacterium]|jgi:GMP synthase (glutamine-hydrolysing)|nr:glutamine-hydrolyzing GMP synthase [Flavobacteriaceae bacterium]MDG1920929.1 glutamine-hydrolyzing GMP synthase [Flavobacteriaceae bacterium]